MYWLKRCPKCCGDLYENVDHHGGYVACFQCGHHLSVIQEMGLRGVLLPLRVLDPRKALPAGIVEEDVSQELGEVLSVA